MRLNPTECTTVAARPDDACLHLSNKEMNRLNWVAKLWKKNFSVEYISTACNCSQRRVVEIIEDLKAAAEDLADPRPGKRSKTGAPVRKRKATSRKATK